MKDVNRKFIYFICLVSALGGFLFGYDWVVIGGAKPFYEVFFGISDAPVLQGWAMSVALLGCLLGAMCSGMAADRYGRKPLLIIAAVIFLGSAYYTGATSDFTVFLFARFLGGIGIGIASMLSPMYIAEVAPGKIRGQLVSINQLTIVLGILAAQIVNWILAEKVPVGYTPLEIAFSWNGQWGWRYMFWAEAYPAILFLGLVFLIPESPRWLILHGKRKEGVEIVQRIGGESYAKEELRAIDQTSKGCGAGGLKILFSPAYRKILLLGVFIAVFQQWCGTNVIFNYAQEIFQSAGFALDDVLFNIVITGIANLVFTFVALFTVDRIGRRMLMWIGAAGLGGIYLILGTCYFFEIHGWFMIVLVVLAIGCYAMSIGPVTWVLLSEIFPNAVRGVSMAVATFSLWMGCFTLTYSFPLLNTFLGSSGTFWLYALICWGGFLFFRKYLPETTGKSLEDLEEELKKH